MMTSPPRGFSQSFQACTPDFRDFKDFSPYFFKDFKGSKYSDGFWPVFKEFRSGVRDFSGVKSDFGLDFRDFR